MPPPNDIAGELELSSTLQPDIMLFTAAGRFVVDGIECVPPWLLGWGEGCESRSIVEIFDDSCDERTCCYCFKNDEELDYTDYTDEELNEGIMS